MKRMIPLTALIVSLTVPAFGTEIDKPIAKPIHERFSSPDVQEVPDFRRHMSPLMGKLGCNGRACHGSFQGRGGFRLSLFGHDFEMDHQALTKGEESRVDLKNPDESLIIQNRPTRRFMKGENATSSAVGNTTSSVAGLKEERRTIKNRLRISSGSTSPPKKFSSKRRAKKINSKSWPSGLTGHKKM